MEFKDRFCPVKERGDEWVELLLAEEEKYSQTVWESDGDVEGLNIQGVNVVDWET